MTRSSANPQVLLTQGAEQDLEAIYDDLADSDCIASANYALDQLMQAVDSLSVRPERSNYPKELSVLGIKEYRQTACKPYRVVHQVSGNQVFNCPIADSRREMQSLLARRLLGA